MENEPEDPEKVFEKVFEEALSLLKEATECADKPPNPDAPMWLISEHLVMLERQIQEFIKGNEEVIQEAKQKNLEKGVVEPPVLSKETQRLLKKSEELVRKADAKRDEIADRVRQGHEAAAAGTDEKANKSKPTKDQPRKNKFRRIGGNRDWKPL